jgi:hypothetical protein
MNVPYSKKDVHRFFDIYGAQIPGLRGKKTKRHVLPLVKVDMDSKLQIISQEVLAEVMYTAGEKFLISVSSPLEILMVCHMRSLSKDAIRAAVQEHINEPRRILVDPCKSLFSSRGAFPGIQIDVCDAGDHLVKRDIRICRVKEMMRLVIAGLPYKLAKDCIKDLVSYVVSQMNLKGTSPWNTRECLRVCFTGFKPDYKLELSLSFWDYVEA